MDSYALPNRYLDLARQFSELCGQQTNIERALANGLPDCDTLQLTSRLTEVRRQLDHIQRSLEQAS